jgi:hypothetical protein
MILYGSLNVFIFGMSSFHRAETTCKLASKQAEMTLEMLAEAAVRTSQQGVRPTMQAGYPNGEI